jgi:hypothetical protein
MLIMSYIGDQVWLMTSRQTEPELCTLVATSMVVKDVCCVQLVDVWVEYPVHEADARTLVWVLVWQLDVDLPETAFEGSCDSSAG